MSINTDFYGNKNDWIALSKDTPDLFKTAYPYDNNESYQGSLKAFQESSVTNPENVASPELDDSIIPWKINEKSDVFNQKYIYPYCTDYTNPQQSTWMYQTSDYTQNVNGGFRFFIQDAPLTNVSTGGPNGVWVQRYSPLNTKGQLDVGAYRRLFPIVGFDYSKFYVQISLLYVEKSAFDDITKPWTTTNVSAISIKDLIDDDSKWQNNYFYGIQYQLRYKGLSGSAHSLGMFAYDKIKASPLSGGYYPYGEDFHHYQTSMTVVYDTGQMGRCQIGGIVGGTGNAFTIRWDSTTHTDMIELFKKNYDDTHCLRHMGGLHDGENIVFNRQFNSSTVRLIPYRTYESDSKQDFINYARKQAAYLGFPFSDQAYNMIDNPDKTYIPEIDSNGVTTGNYALASTHPDYANAEWTTDVYDKTPYDPKNDHGGSDSNTYKDTSNYVSISGVYAPTTERYLMTNECLRELLTQLQKISIPFAFPEEYDPDDLAEYTADVMRAFGTTNPLELIDAVIAYPVDFGIPLDTQIGQLSQLITGATGFLVTVGNSHCDVSKGGLYLSGAQHIEHEAPYLFFPTWEYYNKYKSFLDYSPYSSSVLTLPWCGSVNLDPEIYIGNKLNVLYNVDIDTGLCKAVLYNDGKVVDSINGQVGARIAIETADYNNQVNAAIQANQIQQQQRFNQIKSIASIATAGLATVATGGAGATELAGATIGTAFNMAQSQMTIDQANYRVEAAAVPYKQVVSGTDSLSLMSVNGIHQVIYRPKFLPTYDATEYGKQVGFATLEFGPLSNYHGYTEVETVDFNGVAATEAEQEMIKSALKTGVYLP